MLTSLMRSSHEILVAEGAAGYFLLAGALFENRRQTVGGATCLARRTH